MLKKHVCKILIGGIAALLGIVIGTRIGLNSAVDNGVVAYAQEYTNSSGYTVQLTGDVWRSWVYWYNCD